MLSLSISNALYGFDTLKHSSMPGIGIFVPISICRKDENKIKIDLLGSVTRFGEISPLWQNFNYLWKSFEGSLANFEPKLGNSFAFGQMQIAVNGQILNK